MAAVQSYSTVVPQYQSRVAPQVELETSSVPEDIKTDTVDISSSVSSEGTSVTGGATTEGLNSLGLADLLTLLSSASQMDVNRDGVITEDELTSFLTNGPSAEPEAPIEGDEVVSGDSAPVEEPPKKKKGFFKKVGDFFGKAAKKGFFGLAGFGLAKSIDKMKKKKAEKAKINPMLNLVNQNRRKKSFLIKLVVSLKNYLVNIEPVTR